MMQIAHNYVKELTLGCCNPGPQRQQSAAGWTFVFATSFYHW